MAGKLSIRRVGNFLPSLCLAGVLLVVALITWLCTVGLPDCALRYIEQEAAKVGVQLHIDKIRLSPSSGMAAKAEGVVIELPQQDAGTATLKIRKVQVSYSIARMLTGTFKPYNMRVVDGELTLPLSTREADALHLKGIDLYSVFLPNGKAISTTLRAELGKVEIETRLLLTDPDALLRDLSREEDEKISPEKSLAEQIASIRPYLKELQKQLDQQQWNDGEHPHLKLSAIQGKEWKIDLEASVPSYEHRQFHFRDASISASIEDETIRVDYLNFKTIDPDTAVTLQDGYDWVARELEFNTRSTAPVLRIIRSHLDEEAGRILRKIESAPENTPKIELSGSARLSEDYALNKISIRGKLEQQAMKLGSTPINHLLLSFYMLDGRFNIDAFKLDFDAGHITAQASTDAGSGHVELDVSLPDETLLALARDLSNDTSLELPEGLSFQDNLNLRIKGDMSVPLFEAGKTRLEDLVPTLRSCNIQFNTGKASYAGSTLSTPAVTLAANGIDYGGAGLKVQEIKLDAKLGSATSPHHDAGTQDFILNLALNGLALPEGLSQLAIQQADCRVSATHAQFGDTKLQKLHATSGLSKLEMSFADLAGSLRSAAISAKLHAESITQGDTEARDIYLDASIPEGLRLADAWKNMQKDTDIEARVQELTHGAEFKACNTRLSIRNIAENTIALNLVSSIGDDEARLSGTAALQGTDCIKISRLDMHLPGASLLPLLGGEPLQELKLPRLIELQGDALINLETGTVLDANYSLHIPELVRVCQQVFVHKGMEIPLALAIKGNFSTAPDGSMSYAADISARHELGQLDVNVTGNPLEQCRITGSSTIPVNVINALIDNADAHWIMRDFRCTPGVTRTIVRNIDTTIRYNKGLYVHALCDAELYDLEFLLGAIRDAEDASGNATGGEYLRKDLGSNPYSKVKEGRCGVEVLVQMDCEDAQGNPLPERLRINLDNPDLVYDNKPWLKRMGFREGPSTSRITGEAVRFNLENNTISLHKLKGRCYPAYSIGMYYAPIQHFLADVILQKPAEIETDYCIFPLSRNCDVPMQGLIRAQAAAGAGFKFLGTTIPFTHFSGFINISDVDVYLDRMNAQCWGGAINGSLRIGFSGKHTTLDGFFVASNMNLRDIVASYGEIFIPATCNGYIRFQAAEPELEAVRAYGQVHLKDGDLMQIGLFRPVGALLSDMPGNLAKLQEKAHLKKEEAPPSWAGRVINSLFTTGSNAIDTMQDSAYKVPFANHFLRYGIDEAFARFDITNGHLITRNMKAKGYNLNVGVELDIDLDKLTLSGDLWPKISSVPTVLISPITILSDFLIDINLYGDLLSPQWEFGLSKKLKPTENSLSPEPQVDE